MYSPLHGSNASESYSYFNQYRGEIPGNFEPLAVEFGIVNSNPANFEANISGKFDLYYVLYYNHSKTIGLSISIPVNQKEWKLPDLSTAFNNIEYKFDNFVWSQIQIINYKSIDWSEKYYDACLNFEKLNWLEEYSQNMWIYNSQNSVKKQIDLRDLHNGITGMNFQKNVYP